ncbi:(2,3-dihydroxybenzoyl)adenylate synthase [Vibrio olivae]|uniref:(2,3-dihydroxybenzoyl)adenylate synthase n=1 Tax=Vibrio olivae TaxID=1243002 RepID=A0ABV5HHD8_9VIBR
MMSLESVEFTPWPPALADQYRALGYWQDKTLLDYLRDSVERHPDQTAIICGERHISYREFHQKIAELASGFSQLGLQAGDNVVLQMTNVAEFYFCFFALVQKGIRPIMALPAHRLAEVRFFCQHAEAKAYIINGEERQFDYQQLADQVVNECPSVKHVIVKGPVNAAHQDKFIALDTCYQGADYQQTANPTQVAFFQLSGGTTGTPKLIPRTHNDYAYSVVGSNEICHFDHHTIYLCALPVAHNFPFSSPGALGVFWAAGTLVLSKDPTPQCAFELIERHRVNVSGLVPPLALLWMDHASQTERDISSLALLQVGGAKFSESAARRVPQTLKCQLQQIFGMAEGLVNYTRLDDPDEVIFSTQGRPISPHDQVMVVDEDGQPVKPGEEGFLLTQGPYTIRGYYKAPKHNQRAFNQQGFYATGDIVKRTSQGNIIVTGRDKDQINRGGEKIAAEEVENQMLRHTAIHDAALVAMPDEYLGERSCAVVVLKPEQTLKPIALKRFLRDAGLADYKIPDQIQFVDLLPKTSVGKIDKKTLRQRFVSA